MRLIAWNCNMALHRKVDALLTLRPDIAVISECACPKILAQRGADSWIETDPVWIGENQHKGLGVFAFNGYRLRLYEPFLRTLRHIAPVHVSGPRAFNLLAVWAQNASGGITRKHQLGPLRRALSTYNDFLAQEDAVIAGDLNSNAIWDKPGWRINHMAKVAMLEKRDLLSAYHTLSGEEHGAETVPTHYWRDRRKDGPTYHIDYMFVPRDWLALEADFHVGSFEAWCGNGLSDHVPIALEIR